MVCFPCALERGVAWTSGVLSLPVWFVHPPTSIKLWGRALTAPPGPCPRPLPSPLLSSPEAAHWRGGPRSAPLAFPGPFSTIQSKDGKTFASAQGRQELELRGSLKLFNKQLTQGMSPLAGLELSPPSGEPDRERLSGWAEWVRSGAWGPFLLPQIQTNK